ncbi:hypothetical protein ACVI1L_004101 [Bradyrhizobium sp. USDA 4516]
MLQRRCVPLGKEAWRCAQWRMERSMPVARYFLYIGGVLLALLFLLDATIPNSPLAKQPDSSRPTIRIRSMQKLPDLVVYDTSLPTIVPERLRKFLLQPRPKLSGLPRSFASGKRLPRCRNPKSSGQNRRAARRGKPSRLGSMPMPGDTRRHLMRILRSDVRDMGGSATSSGDQVAYACGEGTHACEP